MTISVAICTWNRCESLEKTLERMAAMSVPDFQWELLVVNNNGTDRTNQVCEQFIGRLPIRLLQEPTPGQSYARNLAIREAKGDQIAWTDDDVLVDANWLTEIARAFPTHEADFVFGPSEPEWSGAVPDWYSNRLRGNFAVLDYGPSAFVVSSKDQPFYGLNFAGTRSAHEELGMFRTDFGLKGKEGGVGEDVDLFERAFKRGMRVVYEPSIRVRHMIPAARATKAYQRRHIWRVNRTYYRHLGEMFPAVPWFLGLPRFMTVDALANLGRYVRGLATFDKPGRFYSELQLVRFVRLCVEATKNGFSKPTTPKPIDQSAVSGGGIS